MKLNKHSQRLTQDESQPASQAMLYAVGLSEEDMHKAHDSHDSFMKHINN